MDNLPQAPIVSHPAARDNACRILGRLPSMARSWLGISLAMIATAGGAMAQDELRMRIDFVAWGDPIYGLSLPDGGGAEITAQAFRYSSPVAYSGPPLMEIHLTGDPNPPDPAPQPSAEDLQERSMPLEVNPNQPVDAANWQAGPLGAELERRREEQPSLVALARLPANSAHATVLLVPADKGTFHTYVIDDDPSTLRAGDLRVHNLSPYRLAFKVGQQPATELVTGQNHTFRGANGQLIYEFGYQRDGRWVVQENNIIPLRQQEQTQMIILKSRHQFFLSADGASGGFLQTVFLRRQPAPRGS
jgi:hypothetical protein